MAAAAGSGDPPAGSSKIQKEKIPILDTLAPAKNGTIHVMGQNIEGKGWDNVFSFTYYYKRWSDNLDFKQTVYYDGLLTYVQMVHGTEFSYTPPTKEENATNRRGHTDPSEIKGDGELKAKLPENIGMIVYTNWTTLELLKVEFPLERYPNLIYAVPDWPYYSNEENILDSDILRTLRYQAVDLFPSLNVHMRDADTLFTAFLYDEARDWARFQFVTAAWETTYLTKFIPEMEKEEKQIVIGASNGYTAFYHSNIPYPIEFTFPIRKPYEKETIINPYKHIYLRSNDYTKENYAKLFAIRNEEIPQEEGESKENYSKRQRALRAKKLANYRETIPPERREIIPYYKHFTKEYKYIYLRGDWGPPGVYAGFCSVLKNRKGIEEFWKNCVDYLVSRYYMSINPETGKVSSTDNAFEEIYILESTGKISAKGVYGFGKDERMLLYGIIPAYFSTIYFFDIRYYKYLNQYRDSRLKDFLHPSYPEKILNHASYQHRELINYFKPVVKSYLKWLADFKKEFPTQAKFLNSIESNFQKRFVPFEEAKAQAPKNLKPFEGLAEPYKEFAKYGRVTLPGKLEGGRHRPRKTRRGSKVSKRGKTRGKRY